MISQFLLFSTSDVTIIVTSVFKIVVFNVNISCFVVLQYLLEIPGTGFYISYNNIIYAFIFMGLKTINKDTAPPILPTDRHCAHYKLLY